MAKNKKTEAETTFATRRRVLKGLGVAPVVYTLSNGSALAATSSHQCLSNQAVDTQPDCAVINAAIPNTPPDNQWVWDKQPQPPGSETHWCVRYAEEDAGFTTYSTTGYDWRFGGTHQFIDQNGTNMGLNHIGHPLTASCAASFI